jgi:hypothetical protein
MTDGLRGLGIAELALYKNKKCEDQYYKGCFDINRFRNPIHIVYDVKGIELVNLTYWVEDHH